MTTKILLLLLLTAVPVSAQTAKAPVKRRPPAAPAPVKPVRKLVDVPADLTCPSALGVGVTTQLNFCDVLTGREPAQGILVRLPPHRGTTTLRFDLHNRHTYSDDEMRNKKGFASYAASIGVLTLDNTLLTRAVVAGEFRRVEDLLDRIAGGAGPAGVKAVAPLGSEPIALTIPAEVNEVSILGEKLTMVRADGTPATYAAPGRPIAIISNVTVEYTPAPAAPPKKAR